MKHLALFMGSNGKKRQNKRKGGKRGKRRKKRTGECKIAKKRKEGDKMHYGPE